MVIKAKVKAVPGDQVIVRNYRKKGSPWENGEVRATEINVRDNGDTSVHYRVWIKRPGVGWSEGYALEVGNEAIEKLKFPVK